MLWRNKLRILKWESRKLNMTLQSRKNLQLKRMPKRIRGVHWQHWENQKCMKKSLLNWKGSLLCLNNRHICLKIHSSINKYLKIWKWVKRWWMPLVSKWILMKWLISRMILLNKLQIEKKSKIILRIWLKKETMNWKENLMNW